MKAPSLRPPLLLVLVPLAILSTACAQEKEELSLGLSVVERTIRVSGQEIEARAVGVTPDVFESRPVFLGRAFHGPDLEPGAPPVVILGHSLWELLGGDPSILGTQLEVVAGASPTIVGVADVGFGASEQIDLFLPGGPAR